MNREVHVRNCEGVGVKLPRATRPRTFARAGLADQTTARSGGQSFLSRPAVVCACCLGFSSGSPLSGGAGLGSFSSIAVKYSGYDG
jgi:hypothetical protein